MGTEYADPAGHIPVFSQSDLDSLALLSAPAAHAASSPSDIVVPKIDRSVFNESAGSRKQTYSRLRLARPSPSTSSSPLDARRSLLPGSPCPPSNASFDSEKAENKHIVEFLRNLFERENGGSSAAASGTNQSPADNPADMSKAMVVSQSQPNSASVSGNSSNGHDIVNVEKVEVLNRRGELVDVVALENNKDLFGDELRRRTSGLQTEAELLEYLRGLSGCWSSWRKRRKIVDAEEFGDDLPRGWKVILAIKKKEERVWLYFHQHKGLMRLLWEDSSHKSYWKAWIGCFELGPLTPKPLLWEHKAAFKPLDVNSHSPSGRQFASCKEVSSYLQSYIGTQVEMQHISSQTNDTSQSPSKINISSTPPQLTGNDSAREVPICYPAVPISSISTNPGQQVFLFRVENPAKVQLRNLLECWKCNLTFDCKDAYVRHLMSVHQRSAKRTTLGKSVGDSLIINGNKYECQFCHKLFDERHRYNGHVGIHVRNYGGKTTSGKSECRVW